MQDPKIMLYRKTDITARSCSELIGICKGVIADHKVCEEEADFLYNWLSANPNATDIYPGKIILRRLGDMFSDKVFDKAECAELLFMLKEATGEQGQHGWGGTTTTLGFDDPMPEMILDAVCVCLTGSFKFGMRSQVEKILESLGAIIKSSPMKTYLNYLIVGELVSDAWKYSTHGRKLEKAIALREEGYPVHVVSEAHMWSELERLGFIAK